MLKETETRHHQEEKEPPSKKELVRLFLFAWYESITPQHERVPLLAATGGVKPAERGYHSQIPPYADRFQWGGMIRGTPWKSLFHGIGDCPGYHPEDGHVTAIRVGPHSRDDSFSGWGTFPFAMASHAPWSAFSELKGYLAQKPPPYPSLSGDHRNMVELTGRSPPHCVFECADQEVSERSWEFTEHYASRDDQGRYSLAFPPPYPDPSKRIFWDVEVCEALVLSEKGHHIFAQGLDPETFSQLWEACMVPESSRGALRSCEMIGQKRR